MDSVYIGLQAEEFAPGQDTDAITKVEILDSNGDVLAEVGTDNGRTLSATNPDGTKEMAQHILTQVNGYVYRPYEAANALIDPAAELGDGVTIGGVYSVLAQTNIILDGLYSADIAAPTDDEIEDEYPYISPLERQVRKNYQNARSLISKTADEIRFEVENELEELSSAFTVELEGITGRVDGLDGAYTELSLTIDGFTVKDSSGTTRIKGSSIETGSLAAGSISAEAVNMTGAITWEDLDSETQNEVNNAKDTASEANSKADEANETISSWTYQGTTYIDGSKLQTGTVQASALEGGRVSLLNNSGTIVGMMMMTGATTADYAIDLESYGALRLSAANGAVWIESGSGVYLDLDAEGTGIVFGNADVRPTGNGQYSCGTASSRWSEVYAATGTIQTSDRTNKTDINYDISAYDALFDALKPASFRFVDGTSGRTHIGMVAQDVEEALSTLGMSTQDFAGFIKSPRTNKKGDIYEGEYIYGLRYNEILPLCIRRIQQLEKRIKTMEDKI